MRLSLVYRFGISAIFAVFVLLAHGFELMDEDYVKANYKKAEFMVPMRDGSRMLTAVYSPKDDSKKYPILLYRTPYSIRAYGSDYLPPNYLSPSEFMIEDGYIFVVQDVRGTYMSEGEFSPFRPIRPDKNNLDMVDESTDNYDTIDWLISNIDNHTGRVGQWGISYLGLTTVMGLVDPHPALLAASPQASPADLWIGDDAFHNGAFRLSYTFSWMNEAARIRPQPTRSKPDEFDYKTPWGYEFFLNSGVSRDLNKKYFDGHMPSFQEFISHPNYDDYWKARNVLNHLMPVNVAVLNVAGWFDAEDFYGPISIYHKLEQLNSGGENSLVIGPWRHAGWHFDSGETLGDINFGSKTSEYYQKNIVSKFFSHYLKGEGGYSPVEAIVFETGKNEWRFLNSWPPKAISKKNIYFRGGGKLSFDRPVSEEGADTYISDPERPVPFSTEIRVKPGHTWMIEDQRLASTRPDVLTFRTEPLAHDVTVAGPILVNLFASTSGTDSDFFVKLIDEYPSVDPVSSPSSNGVHMAGYQMLVGVQAMRAKFRDSFSEPKPMVADEVTPISFNIWDKFHTFKTGHRIMVQVHSSWFPAYDRNPHVFMNIFDAKETDYQKAEQTIYRGNGAASHLVLPVLDWSRHPLASSGVASN